MGSNKLNQKCRSQLEQKTKGGNIVKIRITMVLYVLIGVLLLVGCGGPAPTPETITVVETVVVEKEVIKEVEVPAEEEAEAMGADMSKDPYDALEGSSALILVTEWDEFRQLDWLKVKKIMKNPLILDGRNIYDPEEMKKLGFKYIGIGR